MRVVATGVVVVVVVLVMVEGNRNGRGNSNGGGGEAETRGAGLIHYREGPSSKVINESYIFYPPSTPPDPRQLPLPRRVYNDYQGRVDERSA